MHRRSITAPQLRQVTCKSGPGKEYGANLPVNMPRHPQKLAQQPEAPSKARSARLAKSSLGKAENRASQVHAVSAVKAFECPGLQAQGGCGRLRPGSLAVA